MKLQTKLTLGSVLLATIIVTVVSSVDLYSFMQLKLQATFDRAEVIKDVARLLVTDTVNRHRDVTLPAALEEDPELVHRLGTLMRTPNGVVSIDVVFADNMQVIFSTL